MRLRSSYFSKIQDFKDFLDVYLGRSCAGALDDDSVLELYERLANFVEVFVPFKSLILK